MKIQEAFYHVERIMKKHNLSFCYRGCPNHVIDPEMNSKDGKYNSSNHTVITGKDCENFVLIHECAHALQKPNIIPKGYHTNKTIYNGCRFEQEAFLVEEIYRLQVLIKKFKGE